MVTDVHIALFMSRRVWRVWWQRRMRSTPWRPCPAGSTWTLRTGTLGWPFSGTVQYSTVQFSTVPFSGSSRSPRPLYLLDSGPRLGDQYSSIHHCDIAVTLRRSPAICHLLVLHNLLQKMTENMFEDKQEIIFPDFNVNVKKVLSGVPCNQDRCSEWCGHSI